MVIRSNGGYKNYWHNMVRDSRGFGDGSGSSSGEFYLRDNCIGRGSTSKGGDEGSVSINNKLFVITGRQTRFKIRQSS